MTETQWIEFQKLRQSYKRYIDELSRSLPQLGRLISQLLEERSVLTYPVETPIVYNQALEQVNKDSQIKLILVADNPGQREQSAEYRRYLVGPSGKLADSFFRKHSDLGINFHQQVLILNKTPIHTPRTGELRDLERLGGHEITLALEQSQREMACLAYQFHALFAPETDLWIIGYSEMGRGKLFEAFTETLQTAYAENSRSNKSIYLYRHFSMNQFSIDFNKQHLASESTRETLQRIGYQYRKRILGW